MAWVGAQVISLAVLFIPPGLLGPPWEFEAASGPGTEMLGDVIALAGLGYCTWAAVVLAPKLRTPGAPLCTEGPFGLSRHPMYGGFLAMAAGICVASPGLLLRPLAALSLTFVLVQKTREEERALAKARGEEWKQYKEAVPKRFLPFLL